MRLIDADALKEFINDGRVCDICPNKKFNCVYNCDFPDYLTPLWEKVIDSIPPIDDLSEYSDKLWKQAYERGKAEARPQGEWIDYSADEGYVECPFCEHLTNCEGNIDELHYCWNCGAKLGKGGADMRGGAE